MKFIMHKHLNNAIKYCVIVQFEEILVSLFLNEFGGVNE
ncbi:hypothetical protein SXYLSMQ121_1580 [Staphylococcus xylosus]|nr:hypothetical protein SXYLSMQ121_1580 [Staphylococcus xylosus]